jgi:hypothetical protein
MLDGMERRSLLILTTKTDRAFQFRNFARLWEEATETVVGSNALQGSTRPSPCMSATCAERP